jgi:hypothetical protein
MRVNMTLASVIYTRRLRFLDAECNFRQLDTQCDFDTHECDYDTHDRGFNTHRSDFYTQSVIMTLTSVTYTRTI